MNRKYEQSKQRAVRTSSGLTAVGPHSLPPRALCAQPTPAQRCPARPRLPAAPRRRLPRRVTPVPRAALPSRGRRARGTLPPPRSPSPGPAAPLGPAPLAPHPPPPPAPERFPGCTRRPEGRGAAAHTAGGGEEGTGRDGTGGCGAMNGSANPLLDKEDHPLQLGESFERRPKASFHTIRCEHRPPFSSRLARPRLSSRPARPPLPRTSPLPSAPSRRAALRRGQRGAPPPSRGVPPRHRPSLAAAVPPAGPSFSLLRSAPISPVSAPLPPSGSQQAVGEGSLKFSVEPPCVDGLPLAFLYYSPQWHRGPSSRSRSLNLKFEWRWLLS